MKATVLLKALSDKSIANSAPKNDPMIAGIDKKRLIFHLTKYFLKNSIKAVTFCISIAILLVPLATVEGKPRKINTGKEIRDPPAEITLIKPTRIPVINNIKKLLKGMS